MTPDNPQFGLAYSASSSPPTPLVVAQIDEVARLRLALDQQTQLLDLAYDTILIHDLSDRIAFWNRAAEEMYGWQSEEAVGLIAWKLLHTEFPESLEAVLRALK